MTVPNMPLLLVRAISTEREAPPRLSLPRQDFKVDENNPEEAIAALHHSGISIMNLQDRKFFGIWIGCGFRSWIDFDCRSACSDCGHSPSE
jgi:hypothetical protein